MRRNVANIVKKVDFVDSVWTIAVYYLEARNLRDHQTGPGKRPVQPSEVQSQCEDVAF